MTRQTYIAVVSRQGFATRVVNTGVAEREEHDGFYEDNPDAAQGRSCRRH